ncbi:MAG: DUF3108 domain-containing protein [Candidatus Thiodiazotropha sp. LLP2]
MRGIQSHRGMILRIEALFLALILWGATTAVGAANRPMLGESLEYTLKFRGLITGYVELDIAKMTLEVEQDMGEVFDSPTYITNLQVTTEPYTKAEMLYPVRLKYRSWLDAHKLYPLIAVKSLKARVEREEFFLFDRKAGQAFHYQTGEDEVDEPQLPPVQLRPVAALTETQWTALTQTQAIEMGGEDAIDYMGLIHRLRGMPLESGNPIEFSTYNGKEIEWFRIDVSRERLVRSGWDRETFRLKLREVDPESGDLGEVVHIWMSDDDQRLLLRFYAERTLGSMEGILETGRPLDQGHNEGLSEATQSSMETYLDF